MSVMQKRVQYIEEHKNDSANKIIQNWRNTDLSLRRTDALELIRITRGIKPKSKVERQKYIPRKYRKTTGVIKEPPKIELPTPPEGTYKVAVLTHKTDKYFIKFQTIKSLERQIATISQKYGFLFADSSLEINPKEYTYTPFIDYEFAKTFSI